MSLEELAPIMQDVAQNLDVPPSENVGDDSTHTAVKPEPDKKRKLQVARVRRLFCEISYVDVYRLQILN